MPRPSKSRGSSRGPAPSKKPRLTHFLCIPLVNKSSESQLQHSISAFEHDVCHKQPEAAKSDSHHEKNDPYQSATDEDLTPKPPVPSVTSSTVAKKAIRPVGSLHLTLGVMSLDEAGLAAAQELLSHIDANALLKGDNILPSTQALSNEADAAPSGGPSTLTRSISPPLLDRTGNAAPLIVSLTSLVSMHPPHKTSILYTSPTDSTARLQHFCQTLRQIFQDAGLLVEDKRPLKLHATLVNTIYAKGRKRGPKQSAATRSDGIAQSDQARMQSTSAEVEDDRSEGHGPDAKAPLRIDARDILRRYSDHVWADNILLDRAAICEMGAKNILNDRGEVVKQEYKEMATLRLPGKLH
ncbi:hypothetical protein AAFC00_002132 [Neodothiora populina]|uniref:A-kinase anchor protein 7-like phosphoesterase domain-containing protein n=1 Tax=Neodothiora populina TaxID=2781224 RepID=A0ABR3PGG7_9PEZI